MEAFKIENLTFAYPNAKKAALEAINLAIRQGEFITLCGPSGCGKSTLLRQLKSVLQPHGRRSGEIYFDGVLLDKLNQREQSSKIGFVLQNPDNQIVTDKVWHELAFGLESLGYDTKTIRLRVAEMASFFGIQTWFHKSVTELSGGQKQLLNLASVMAMQPAVLILDEPTSQLDPIAASEFISTVAKINRELGTTIIMTEHRLDEVISLSDRVIVMEDGAVIADGEPKKVGAYLKQEKSRMFLSMPVPMRIYADIDNDLECPLTVRDGREWLDKLTKNKDNQNDKAYLKNNRLDKPSDALSNAKADNSNETVLEFNDVWFRYDKQGQDIVKDLSFKVKKGELYTIVGGNGTGKTTTLSLISGINQPYRGRIKIFGIDSSKISANKKFDGLFGVLPQNPQSLFVAKTVKKDLYEILSDRRLSETEKEKRINDVVDMCRLQDLADMHPYDLSGGEQQRAGLAKVLLLDPQILLLDEPTKGLDSDFKHILAEIFYSLLRSGKTIIMVSHDIEFCAEYADRCAMFFGGSIVTENTPKKFFAGNSFYTTSANRMCRGLMPDIVTVNDAITDICRATENNNTNSNNLNTYYSNENYSILNNNQLAKNEIKHKLTQDKLEYEGLCKTRISKNKMNQNHIEQQNQGEYIIKQHEFDIKALEDNSAIIASQKQQLSKRTRMAIFMILIVIPLTIFVGMYYFGDRKYYFIGMLIILETILPFVMIFENRKPQARELIVIAVLSAIAVAGRGAFFMIPQFKPVVAITIIAGVCFGGESGFLVGAVSGFVSNFFFGQGPWTPWQMFSFGIIGFLAGIMFRKGMLQKNTIPLSIFGALSTFFIYGGLMNPASVLMYQAKPTWEMIMLAYLRGVPFDLIHAASTFIFLLFISKPMIEKLERIKTKYGLL